MNHPASFAVRLNGAQGKMAAKVHSPSGALEECVVTELEKGLCVFSRQHIAANRRLKKPQKSAKKEKRKLFWLVTKLFCPPDKYAVRFIPRENGIHYIDVKFNGSHIPGSPFQVRVGEPGQTGEPGLVSAYGAGLEKGTTGESPVRLFT